jgi:hypothetical protein
VEEEPLAGLDAIITHNINRVRPPVTQHRAAAHTVLAWHSTGGNP